ncbi:hypothetical protein ABIA39_001245 [Nocardia sp. GAS34]
MAGAAAVGGPRWCRGSIRSCTNAFVSSRGSSCAPPLRWPCSRRPRRPARSEGAHHLRVGTTFRRSRPITFSGNTTKVVRQLPAFLRSHRPGRHRRRNPIPLHGQFLIPVCADTRGSVSTGLGAGRLITDDCVAPGRRRTCVRSGIRACSRSRRRAGRNDPPPCPGPRWMASIATPTRRTHGLRSRCGGERRRASVIGLDFAAVAALAVGAGGARPGCAERIGGGESGGSRQNSLPVFFG